MFFRKQMAEYSREGITNMRENCAWLLETYKQKGIRGLLQTNEEKALNTLTWATKNDVISPYSPQGKNIWREILKEYNENGPWETCAILKEKLYESTSSRFKQDILSIFVDFSAAFAKGLTFGMHPVAPIVDFLREKAYDRHISRFLHSQRA